MKFCTNCGKEIPENAKFCPECGATTDENAAGGDSAVTLAEGATAGGVQISAGGGAQSPKNMPDSAVNQAAKYTPPGRLSFSGRATRGEWFTTSLIAGVLTGLLVPCCMLLATSMDGSKSGFTAGLIFVINFLVGIFLVIWALATQVRRLHDIGWSGLAVLLPLIPFVGWIAGLVLWVVELFMDGQPGPNRYGPDPKGRPSPYAGGTVTGTIHFSAPS